MHSPSVNCCSVNFGIKKDLYFITYFCCSCKNTFMG